MSYKRERQKTSTLNSLQKLQNRSLQDKLESEKVKEACKCFELSNEQLQFIMVQMNNSFEVGLRPETASTAAVKMLPSYVRSVPNGTERGKFLALDLGGTNFRILLIEIDGKKSDMISQIYRVPDHIMKGTEKALFDHIASCLYKFVSDHNLLNYGKLPLGFTFSFPCKQEGLTCAKLVNWTKGFKASGVEGKDVVKLLRDACFRRGDIEIDVVAVLNDTTGTMMACAFQENTCNIGVICGTGSNACYMERIDRIYKLKDELFFENSESNGEMCINTEWGGFGDDGSLNFIRTKYDYNLDSRSINRGQQIMEKMISGMYMGELVREVLLDLAQRKILFNGDFDAISQPGCFPTKFVSEIESEMLEVEENQFRKTQTILEDIGIQYFTAADCANVAYVCSIISTRAAHLCACGIATLLKRMEKPFVTVGVDGSVYRFHPTFHDLLDNKINELLEGKYNFQLMLSEDGSGRGAALVAAVATRMANEKNVV